MKRLFPLVLVVMALVLATGCRSTRQAAAPVVVADSDTPVEVKREYSVLNFSATVAGISANGQLRMAQDSVLWLSVSKLIELGRAMATVDSVWVSVPMMDTYFAGTYAELSLRLGRQVTFDELQQMAQAPDAEERVVRLARELGYEASVSITKRQRVDKLSFPFRKNIQP